MNKTQIQILIIGVMCLVPMILVACKNAPAQDVESWKTFACYQGTEIKVEIVDVDRAWFIRDARSWRIQVTGDPDGSYYVQPAGYLCAVETYTKPRS